MQVDARNWKALLSSGQVRLEQAGIEEAGNKLRWVAAHLLGCGLLDVLGHLSETPSSETARRFDHAVGRLATDEPVQYVIGETDFMGLRIRCDPRALIPRPETEGLVGCAEEFLRGRKRPSVVVDVCTGTGCIACALATRVPEARVLATDISPAALELARINARELGADVEFRQADLLEGVADASADLVVSNPPYVSTGECGRLPRTVRDFEPRLALDGGRDGLQAISRLVSGAARVLTSEGRLMMEIGDDQAGAVSEILCKTDLLKFLGLRSDCAGRERIAIARRTAR
ncbi:MAG TPA: peptide chain release factor N(5)-glutamine methyltransferase [Verrucomicrobia bacterium]|nr:peptide chain release factor N(5)-glutamine methyltransferase [Verrucomicrobiota bacterium]